MPVVKSYYEDRLEDFLAWIDKQVAKGKMSPLDGGGAGGPGDVRAPAGEEAGGPVRIEIDYDGYPTEESLEALERWSGPGSDVPKVLDAVASYFEECGYGRVEREETEEWRYWRPSTGGWSGCEAVIKAIPALVDVVAWESSHRGGFHIYHIYRIGGVG